MKIAIILSGLHRVVRGAEVAFEAIAYELAQLEDVDVTLFGSGQPRESTPYKFVHVNTIPREYFEKWPRIKPVLRNERVYEELFFTSNLFRKYRSQDFDVTIACTYPFANWFLSRSGGKKRPCHVYVTQNGDNPARLSHLEWQFFKCDGLVCTNQEYFERNKDEWFCKIITNGVDPKRFYPGSQDRKKFDLPESVPLVLMVSALMPSKRVIEGIRATSQLEGINLVVCGDGPERERVNSLGNELMPGRFFYRKLSHEQMPDMYRASDMFLHMSMDEPFGNVYIEALATGLPIIAHDRDVSRWVLEDTSVLVDTTNLSQVKSGILKALQLKTDAHIEKRRSLAETRYAWSEIGQSYYNFLREVLEKNSCGSTDRKAIGSPVGN